VATTPRSATSERGGDDAGRTSLIAPATIIAKRTFARACLPPRCVTIKLAAGGHLDRCSGLTAMEPASRAAPAAAGWGRRRARSPPRTLRSEFW